MKKNFLLTVLLFCSSINAWAQIEEELINYVDTTEIRINNGRKLLVNYLQSNDKDKVIEIYHYLNDVSKLNNCDALNIHEKLYLLGLTDAWQEWLLIADNYKEYKYMPCYTDAYEIENQLYNLSVEKADKVDIIPNDNHNFAAEEKSLIQLYYNALQIRDNEERYSKNYKQFKKNYPNSKYNYFIKHYLPTPKTKGNWGYTIGSSYTTPTNKLADNFDSHFNVYISMDFTIKRYYFSLFFEGGSPKLTQSFSGSVDGYSEMYKSGEHFTYFNGGLLAGYFITESKYFKCAPYLAIGGSSLMSDHHRTEDDDLEFEVYSSFVFGPGIHNEIKLWEFKSGPNYYGISINNVVFLKIDAGYNFITNHRFNDYDGNQLYVRAAIGWALGDF